MIRFITKIVSLCSVVALTYIALGFLADGYSDPFYLRFTSSKQKSMILGTSRAAQGVVPEILNNLIERKNYEGSIYNYSFTVLHSPFGKTYYKAIEEKLDKDTKNGLFIVTVDPWSIASRIDIDHDRETELELSKINTFNSFPNYDYLKNAYQESFFYLLKKKTFSSKTTFLHEDGWLEVSIDTTRSLILKSMTEKISDYKYNQLPQYKISKNRLEYLKKTVKFLKNKGKVILVRLPVDKKMLAIENELSPKFNKKMKDLGKDIGSLYLNYDDNGYLFPDGHHLYKESGKEFSVKLANDINQLYLNE